MTEKKFYEKFDKTVSQAVVWGKAASIDAKIDCFYAESFMIGILTLGVNEVTSVLSQIDVDMEKCLKSLKAELVNKRVANEVKGDINYDDLKISKVVVDAGKIANKIRADILHSDLVGVQHIFIALLRVSDFIRTATDLRLTRGLSLAL